MARLTEKAVAAKITEAKGNVAAVARAFGVSRQAVSQYIARHPKLQEATTTAREEMLDNAESKLYSEMMAGNTAALIFFLKTQGKRRGYIERGEVALINQKDVDAAIERELARVAGRSEVSNASSVESNADAE